MKKGIMVVDQFKCRDENGRGAKNKPPGDLENWGPDFERNRGWKRSLALTRLPVRVSETV